MQKDILVATMEDDLFSRNWMALLMVRDWRTRLIEEITSLNELRVILENPTTNLDILLLSVDRLANETNLRDLIKLIENTKSKMKILCTGVHCQENIYKYLNNDVVCGYMLKNEIGYALAWAISFAFEGNWIYTSSTLAMAMKLNAPIMQQKMVLAGRTEFPGFSDREAEVARLAFIFSLGRRDLAGELKISDQWSYGMVSELYSKLGLGDILSGEVDPIHYLGDNPVLLDRFKGIIEKIGPSRKAKDIEALAFHFMTMPEIL